MWVDHVLKVPDDGEWLAVVRVDAGGTATLVTYLGDAPADAERDLAALQQRWTLRATWPGDQAIQDGARVFEFQKYLGDLAVRVGRNALQPASGSRRSALLRRGGRAAMTPPAQSTRVDPANPRFGARIKHFTGWPSRPVEFLIVEGPPNEDGSVPLRDERGDVRNVCANYLGGHWFRYDDA